MTACPNCGFQNAEAVKFCAECGHALIAATVPARETRRTVTVLFADVTGSTPLGEQLDPESLRALIGRYFSAMKGIIERHGGTVEKFIGDAVMAVFGIPTRNVRGYWMRFDVLHQDGHGALTAMAGGLREDVQAAAVAVDHVEVGQSPERRDVGEDELSAIGRPRRIERALAAIGCCAQMRCQLLQSSSVRVADEEVLLPPWL
jgi:class 3 adenylate cyclase